MVLSFIVVPRRSSKVLAADIRNLLTGKCTEVGHRCVCKYEYSDLELLSSDQQACDTHTTHMTSVSADVEMSSPSVVLRIEHKSATAPKLHPQTYISLYKNLLDWHYCKGVN